jgi:hypothetical protein
VFICFFLSPRHWSGELVESMRIGDSTPTMSETLKSLRSFRRPFIFVS